MCVCVCVLSLCPFTPQVPRCTLNHLIRQLCNTICGHTQTQTHNIMLNRSTHFQSISSEQSSYSGQQTYKMAEWKKRRGKMIRGCFGTWGHVGWQMGGWKMRKMRRRNRKVIVGWSWQGTAVYSFLYQGLLLLVFTCPYNFIHLESYLPFLSQNELSIKLILLMCCVL